MGVNVLYLFSSVFLGWSLGANDAANVFGTAVSSRMVKFSSAAILTAIFVIFGSYWEGAKGIETVSTLTSQSFITAFISLLSAAITMTIMTILKLPVSSSQAAIGGIIGIGLYNNSVDFSGLEKVVICWIGTPIGSMIIAIILYIIFRNIFNNLNLTVVQLDFIIRVGLIISGCYAAYALGSNNVASIIGVFAPLVSFSPRILALIGGFSIAFGVLTFSKNVMYTVGKKLVPIGGFSAFIAILAESITVHIYTKIGVPVSTSQAIIGAVLGVGIINGIRTINFKTMVHIFGGWVSTPILSIIISIVLINIYKIILFYS